MAFTGHEDHSISLSTAASYTKNYRDSNPNQVKGHFFGRDAIEDALDQTGCVGIRIYYGVDETGKKQLIIVGVNADENDLYNGIILDRSIQCPPNCGIANPLNSNTSSGS